MGWHPRTDLIRYLDVKISSRPRMEPTTLADSTIIYTHTDEAPALATASLLPIVSAFARQAGVEVETRDISLAGAHPRRRSPSPTQDQRVGDALAELGAAGQDARRQHHQAAQHLGLDPAAQGRHRRAAGAGLRPARLPRRPGDRRGEGARAAYDKVKGSAVNPVLREGNSDRRAPASVKSYARKHPHSMGAWSADSKTNVATMDARRLPSQREVRRHRRPTRRCASSTSAPTARRPCSRSRSRCSPARSSTPPSCDVAALRDFLAAQIAARQGRGRAPLGAPQGDDDEGLRPDHLRPRRARLLPRRLRRSTPPSWRRRGDPNDGLGAVLAAVATLPADQRAASRPP